MREIRSFVHEVCGALGLEYLERTILHDEWLPVRCWAIEVRFPVEDGVHSFLQLLNRKDWGVCRVRVGYVDSILRYRSDHFCGVPSFCELTKTMKEFQSYPLAGLLISSGVRTPEYLKKYLASDFIRRARMLVAAEYYVRSPLKEIRLDEFSELALMRAQMKRAILAAEKLV